MKKCIKKIIIAGTDEENRNQYRKYLETLKFFEVIKEVCILQELINSTEIGVCDIILLEIKSDVLGINDAIKLLIEKSPGINIVVIMDANWEEYFFDLQNSEIKGFIIKSNKMNEIKKVIKEISEGKHYFSQEIMVRLQNYVAGNIYKQNVISKREKEILQLFAKDLTEQEIAYKLFIDRSTVYTHKHNLLNKTGTKNLAELIKFAKKFHLL